MSFLSGTDKSVCCATLCCFAALSLQAAGAKPEAPLPIIEVPATQGTSDTLVVLVSGDGGWAAIDKAIAKALATKGMPVAGLNALQYFWTKRTPEQASRDLEIIVERYTERWKMSRVVFIGYSRGADVLPAMINRLPEATKARIRLIALLGPSPKVQFEFHMADWLRDPASGELVKPEVDKLRGQKILCLWGEDDKDSLCSGLAGEGISVVTLKGSHHFDGGYERLAGIILEHM
ncbi:MAG TPA: AcvB/VirJ family lysyl-phosphatidylglycerol hydrolase [Thermoanaerobaculia bacterium]|nr:AcvB/VirJ family lysyl-phosphatidylglycerol hydrolase [Thermoanaerobaculia bacterium]